MATYQTGVSNNTHTLLATINSFLVANGWTSEQADADEKIDGFVGDVDGRKTYYYSRLGGYFFLTTGINGATVDYRNWLGFGVLEGHTNSDGDTGPVYSYENQSGYIYLGMSTLVAGPYTAYHLFAGSDGDEGDYFYCVLELSSGLFSHFGLGRLDRVGSAEGRFAVGLSWSRNANYQRNPSANYHQRMFDSHSAGNSGVTGHLHIVQPDYTPARGNAYAFGYGSDHCYGGSIGGKASSQTGEGGLNQALCDDGPNSHNGRTVLIPNHVTAAAGDGWFRIVGIAPGFRTVMIDNLQPGDTVDTDWMVFPVIAKNSASGPSSANLGWAYKFL